MSYSTGILLPGAAAPEPALYSMAGLGRLAQNVAFVRELKLLFLEEVPGRLRELRAALDAAEWTQLARLAHSLKSTVGTLGLPVAVQLLTDLERQAARSADQVRAAALLRELEPVLDAVLQQLGRELHGGSPVAGAA